MSFFRIHFQCDQTPLHKHFCEFDDRFLAFFFFDGKFTAQGFFDFPQGAPPVNPPPKGASPLVEIDAQGFPHFQFQGRESGKAGPRRGNGF